MTIEANAAAAPPVAKWLRPALIAVALLEVVDGVLGLVAFANLPAEDRSPAHWLVFINVALHPILAAIAAYAALTRKLPIAIMALAAMAIVELFFKNIPLIGPSGLDVSPVGVVLFVQIYLLPALCLIALWLASQNRRLQLAGVLAMLPSLMSLLGVIVFGVAVAIYGF
jgi:hypothetical protein